MGADASSCGRTIPHLAQAHRFPAAAQAVVQQLGRGAVAHSCGRIVQTSRLEGELAEGGVEEVGGADLVQRFVRECAAHRLEFPLPTLDAVAVAVDLLVVALDDLLEGVDGEAWRHEAVDEEAAIKGT